MNEKKHSNFHKLVWEEKEEKQETETGTRTSASLRTERSEDLVKAPEARVAAASPPRGPGLPGAPRQGPRLHKVDAAPTGHCGRPRTVTAQIAKPWPGQPEPPSRGLPTPKVTFGRRPSHTLRRRKYPEPGGYAPLQEPSCTSAALAEAGWGAPTRSPCPAAPLLCEPSSTRSNSQSGDSVSTAIAPAPPTVTAPTSLSDNGGLTPAAVIARDFRPGLRPSLARASRAQCPCRAAGTAGKASPPRWQKAMAMAAAAVLAVSSRCYFGLATIQFMSHAPSLSSLSLYCLQAIFIPGEFIPQSSLKSTKLMERRLNKKVWSSRTWLSKRFFQEARTANAFPVAPVGALSALVLHTFS